MNEFLGFYHFGPRGIAGIVVLALIVAVVVYLATKGGGDSGKAPGGDSGKAGP